MKLKSFKKIISLITAGCLLFTFSSAVFAGNFDDSVNSESVFVDGNEYIISYDNNFVTTVESVDGRARIIIRNDAIDTAEVINEYGEKCDYELDIQNLSTDNVDVKVIDDGIVIEEYTSVDDIIPDEYEGQTLVAPLLAPLIYEALIAFLSFVVGAVVIGGVTCYVASEVIPRLKRDQPRVHYYLAVLNGYGDVYISTAVSDEAAPGILAGRQNLFATSAQYAYNACLIASPIRKVSTLQKHGNGASGYYWHYHPMIGVNSQSLAHCWYM